MVWLLICSLLPHQTTFLLYPGGEFTSESLFDNSAHKSPLYTNKGTSQRANSKLRLQRIPIFFYNQTWAESISISVNQRHLFPNTLIGRYAQSLRTLRFASQPTHSTVRTEKHEEKNKLLNPQPSTLLNPSAFKITMNERNPNVSRTLSGMKELQRK